MDKAGWVVAVVMAVLWLWRACVWEGKAEALSQEVGRLMKQNEWLREALGARQRADNFGRLRLVVLARREAALARMRSENLMQVRKT